MNLPKPLNCSEVGDDQLIKALLRHELDEEAENQILAHLRSCPHCLHIAAIVLLEKFKNQVTPDI